MSLYPEDKWIKVRMPDAEGRDYIWFVIPRARVATRGHCVECKDEKGRAKFVGLGKHCPAGHEEHIIFDEKGGEIFRYVPRHVGIVFDPQPRVTVEVKENGIY